MQRDLREIEAHLRTLVDELHNFQEIAKYLIPSSGEIPTLQGVDIYGKVVPLNGIIGGDHIIYVDFSRRYDLDERISHARAAGADRIARNLEECKHKAGIVVSDVSGHKVTDALLNAMLHQAFLLGCNYELEMNGQITTKLFEMINTRVYNSSSIDKYLTMIYGEISQDGIFRFISAGHPLPIVFSNQYDRLVDISRAHLTTFPPIGFMPSQKDPDVRHIYSPIGYKEEYQVNELNLMGSGDILLLYTDGLSEHRNGWIEYFPRNLEDTLRAVKHLSAREIYEKILDDVRSFGEPCDDLTYVVIKKR